MENHRARPNPLHRTAAHLLSLLRRGEALTSREITERLSISSKRHARRLVSTLRDRDFPVQERSRDKEKEFFLSPEDWATDVQLDLTERQALALLLAVSAARSGLGPAPLETELKEAFENLIERIPRSIATFEPMSLLENLHFGEASSVDVDPGVFVQLVRALSNRRSVEIDYYSASSDTYYEGRDIDPWGLAVRGDAWLCVAQDYKHGERRDFNLSRIEDLRPRYPESNGGDYRVPEDFDLEAYFQGRFEALAGDEAYVVRLLLEPEVVPYFESKTYHRTQQIHEDDPAVTDSSEEDRGARRAVVSYEVAGLDEIAAFVRSWGASVKVLGPPELADRIAREAKATAQRYSDVAGDQESRTTRGKEGA